MASQTIDTQTRNTFIIVAANISNLPKNCDGAVMDVIKLDAYNYTCNIYASAATYTANFSTSDSTDITWKEFNLNEGGASSGVKSYSTNSTSWIYVEFNSQGGALNNLKIWNQRSSNSTSCYIDMDIKNEAIYFRTVTNANANYEQYRNVLSSTTFTNTQGCVLRFKAQSGIRYTMISYTAANSNSIGFNLVTPGSELETYYASQSWSNFS